MGTNTLRNIMIVGAILIGLIFAVTPVALAADDIPHDASGIIIDRSPVDGWPRTIGNYMVVAPIAADDVDGNIFNGMELVILEGLEETLAPCFYTVHIVRADGSYLPGWPGETIEFGITCNISNISIADLDGDETNGREIILSISSDDSTIIYAWHSDGSLVANWPKMIDSGRSVSLVVANLDMDASNGLEVIAGNIHRIYAMGSNGAVLPGWPASAGTEWSEGSIIAEDYDGDPANGMEIIVQSAIPGISNSGGASDGPTGQIAILHSSGSVALITPRAPGDTAFHTTPPAVGHIGAAPDTGMSIVKRMWNNDASSDGLYRYDGYGAVPGWSFTGSTGAYDYLCSPAIVDLDNDGSKDVIGQVGAQIYTWDASGSVRPGWPIASAEIFGDFAIGDIDGNPGNGLEIIFASFVYDQVQAYHADGTGVPGWPKTVIGWMQYGPIIADIDGVASNGLEVAVVAGSNRVYMWHTEPISDDADKKPWPMYRQNPQRTGCLIGGARGGRYDADFIPQPNVPVLPPVIRANGRYQSNLFFRNTGTEIWRRLDGVELRPIGVNWGINSVPLGEYEAIMPEPNYNDTKHFEFTVTAPPEAGNYYFGWQMYKEEIGFFGEQFMEVVRVLSPYHARCVSQNVPARMGRGMQYNIPIVFENDGTVPWFRDELGEITFGLYAINNTWGIGSIQLEAGETVPVGSRRTFDLPVTAPATPGRYSFRWQLKKLNEWIDDPSPNVEIEIVDPLPDLAIGIDDITTTPGQAELFSAFTCNVIVHNYGVADASGVVVTLAYPASPMPMNLPSYPRPLYVFDRVIDRIPAGGSGICQFEIPAGAYPTLTGVHPGMASIAARFTAPMIEMTTENNQLYKILCEIPNDPPAISLTASSWHDRHPDPNIVNIFEGEEVVFDVTAFDRENNISHLIIQPYGSPTSEIVIPVADAEGQIIVSESAYYLNHGSYRVNACAVEDDGSATYIPREPAIWVNVNERRAGPPVIEGIWINGTQYRNGDHVYLFDNMNLHCEVWACDPDGDTPLVSIEWYFGFDDPMTEQNDLFNFIENSDILEFDRFWGGAGHSHVNTIVTVIDNEGEQTEAILTFVHME